MNRLQTYWHKLPAEEKANTLTHLVPLVATLLIAWPLTDRAYHSAMPMLNLFCTSLYLLGMLLMFGSSTFYHFVTSPIHKARLRVFDHIAIYTMIAGSYSIVCLSVIGGWLGWTMFIFLWACVLAGVIGKVVALGKRPGLSLALYLSMGWVGVLVLVPMWNRMPHAAFWWVIAEGVLYTIGSYFFRHDEEHAFYHAIWHVFIVLGAASHTVATWLILCA